MSQATATLDRAVRLAPDTSAHPATLTSIDRARFDDDEDPLDGLLASLSVDEFERFLSRLAELC